MDSSYWLFGQVHFQFKGCQDNFIFTIFLKKKKKKKEIYLYYFSLKKRKKRVFKVKSIDTEQMPHLWHLIRVYTFCQCPSHGSLGLMGHSIFKMMEETTSHQFWPSLADTQYSNLIVFLTHDLG